MTLQLPRVCRQEQWKRAHGCVSVEPRAGTWGREGFSKHFLTKTALTFAGLVLADATG